jgi:hypothetical protein
LTKAKSCSASLAILLFCLKPSFMSCHVKPLSIISTLLRWTTHVHTFTRHNETLKARLDELVQGELDRAYLGTAPSSVSSYGAQRIKATIQPLVNFHAGQPLLRILHTGSPINLVTSAVEKRNRTTHFRILGDSTNDKGLRKKIKRWT